MDLTILYSGGQKIEIPKEQIYSVRQYSVGTRIDRYSDEPVYVEESREEIMRILDEA